MRLPIIVALALVCAQQASADAFWSQFVDPQDGRFDASEYLAENAFGFLPVPVIITDPAVDGGLGAVGLFFHETDEQREIRRKALQEPGAGGQSILTPNLSGIGAAYTGNGSWFVGGGHLGFFREGRTRYLGGGGYGDVNLDFFGIGDVNLDDPIELNTRAAAVLQALKFKLGELPIFVGFTQRYVDASIRPGNLGDLSGDLLPPDSQERWEEAVRNLLTQDVTTSGLGVVMELDTRDNLFSPHSGYAYEFEQLWYRDAFGSDVDYELSHLKGLNYWKLTERWRGALRVDLQNAETEGLLPPYATPSIQLRGIQAMRYQGNAVAVAEAEITWQVDLRWSVNVFAGSGWAANDFGDLSDAPSRLTRGAGFRYLIASRYGFEMGIDIARGPEQNVFYIQAGTAW